MRRPRQRPLQDRRTERQAWRRGARAAAGTEELREHACEFWNLANGLGAASEPAHLAQQLVAGG